MWTGTNKERKSSLKPVEMDKKESVIPVVDETSRRGETRNREIAMEVGIPLSQIGMESPSNNNDFFCPIEHPIEPPGDEDQPVKCPMPHSSLINGDRFSDSARKRTESSTGINKEGKGVAAATEPPAQAVRKRHHKSTHGDHTLTPLLRMQPLNPLPIHNHTIFQMLPHFNNFEE